MDSLINLLEDLLKDAEDGLVIDEQTARRIKFFLDLEVEKAGEIK